MKLFTKISLLFVFSCFLSLVQVYAQGEVTRSGNTWSARVNGNTVYTGSRMFDAVNAACGNAGTGATINIRNSGDSGEDGGNVYAIRPLAGQTLDFHGHTVNCNSSGDLAVAVHADRRNGITLRNLRVTGNPRYGLWFRGCSDVTLTNITMDLSNDSPVGLGIRVDASTAAASNLTINGTTTITGSKGHGIETYGLNGVSIGDVTVTNTGGCGVLLNQSQNCTVGVVTGNYNCYGGGYATFRVANDNGSTHVDGVYSRNSGRGFFSVSGSHDCTIDWVDIANSTSQGIFLEDATNTHVLSGTVVNGNPDVQLVRSPNCTVNVNGSGGGGPDCGTCGSGILSGAIYRITPKHDQSKSIELYNFESANGTNVNQWEYWGGEYQHWVARDRGNGYWSFHPVAAQGRSMDIWEMSQDDGATINIYDYWGGDGQQFYFSNAGSGGWVRIKSRLSGKCLDVLDGSSDNGANLIQWECISNQTNQMFRFEPVAAGSQVARVNFDEEKITQGEISIYPNPAQSTINLQLPKEPTEAAFYQIFDVNGSLLSSAKILSASSQLDVSFLQPGAYVLLINDESVAISHKINIQ
ncbi:RICIN domain-containing protein [Fulvivirga maritima]|uniref:RICIN domain-containing protein n=1 Tax=Fulvivirga maritima TaxID=2904247 RepID=UPI001F3E64B9|nr:RICIN domain-containing protein [Fulvivirga maritima]UII28615.1 RICIN domain-containing protein [Fulvivirga maritima]